MDAAQKLERVRDIVVRLQEAEELLRLRQDVPVDKYFYDKIEEWAGKILGVSSGYDAEFRQMYKHRIEKSRELVGGHGDVTVGWPDDIHAKSVQLKSTIGGFSNVNTMIKVALNQLSGERGEQPRENDRMVVDMTMLGNDNSWPTGPNLLGALDWQAYNKAASDQILFLCSTDSYRRHIGSGKKKQDGYGLSPDTRNHMTDVMWRQTTMLRDHWTQGHPNSTQVLANVWGRHPSQGEKVIHLTIKLRYEQGYPIKTGQNLFTGQISFKYLRQATYNVIRVGDQLQASPAKLIFFGDDGGFERISVK